MATMNPFDLLGDDAEDPSHQIAAAEQLILKAAAAAANAPAKPLTQPNKPSLPGQFSLSICSCKAFIFHLLMIT